MKTLNPQLIPGDVDARVISKACKCRAGWGGDKGGKAQGYKKQSPRYGTAASYDGPYIIFVTHWNNNSTGLLPK